MKLFQAVYQRLPGAPLTEEPAESARLFESHAATWREAALEKLPRYLYPAGRRYRRISGPWIKQDAG